MADTRGVPEVWLVDLPNDRSRSHRPPQGDCYRDVASVIGPAGTPAPGLAVPRSIRHRCWKRK